MALGEVVEHAYNVRARKIQQYLRLTLETLMYSRISANRQFLDDYLPLKRRMDCLVDGSHTAHCNHRKNLIFTNDIWYYSHFSIPHLKLNEYLFPGQMHGLALQAPHSFHQDYEFEHIYRSVVTNIFLLPDGGRQTRAALLPYSSYSANGTAFQRCLPPHLRWPSK